MGAFMNRSDFRKIAGSAFRGLLWCAAVGVLFQNVILLRQNRQLKQVHRLDEVSAGERLNNLEGIGLDGRLESISLPTASSPRMLIITFSPGCPACQASQSTWMRLSRELRPRGWLVLWVSRDPIELTSDYAKQKEIPPSYVVADPPRRTYFQLSLEAVPNTIVVGPGGLVEKVWSGALEPDKWEEISAYFDAPTRGLPATIESSQTAAAPAPEVECCKIPAQNP
jgi:hypothetical protein